MRTIDWKHWVAFGVAALWAVLSGTRASANVTVTSFTAQAQASQIVLNWRTASEISNAGFNIYRSPSPSGPWNTKLNSNLIPACPGCALGASYSFTDSSPTKGQTLYYRLESVEFGGATQPFGPVSAQVSASATPTTVSPTSTRTATTTTTATNTLTPGSPTATVYISPTPTVYSSPTPVGTPMPTDTRFPTRVAYVVEATFTPVPAVKNRSIPPISNVPSPAPAPLDASPQASNDQPANGSTNLGSSDSPNEPDDVATAPPDAPSPDLLGLGLVSVAGLVAVFGLSLGAVSLYLIAQRFVR